MLGTMVLCSIVIGLLGWALLRQVAAGLVDSTYLGRGREAQAGFENAQEELDASLVSATSTQSQVLSALIDSRSTSRSGSPRSYEVVLQGPLSANGKVGPDAGTRSSAEIEAAAIPASLTDAIARSTRTHWTYTRPGAHRSDRRPTSRRRRHPAAAPHRQRAVRAVLPVLDVRPAARPSTWSGARCCSRRRGAHLSSWPASPGW
ncbi:MAG: hypothetical protein WKF83_13300 [Nocardioidaceae bacterium]